MTGLDLRALHSTVSVEIFATHLALPAVITLGLAYAAEVMRRLEVPPARQGAAA